MTSSQELRGVAWTVFHHDVVGYLFSIIPQGHPEIHPTLQPFGFEAHTWSFMGPGG